tara:strand:- start:528 stop:905 length:378 start_codon:yes stop_codon:yes gene_type:complete
MRTIILILITTITLQAQPDTIPSFNHLQKFKKEFYSNNYHMAVYTLKKWNVPVCYTLAMAAQKTNYGRNGRYKVGDVFNTGKEYPIANAWDEFGLMMKTTHNFIEHTRVEAISISKKTEELGIKF